MLLVGTVMDIPLHSNLDGSAMYLILFNNGTSVSIPLADMASLIPRPPVLGDGLSKTSSGDNSSLLPPFLQIRSCITYEHKEEYHKGFIARNTCGTYRFSFNTHVKKKSEDWGVDIPNLPSTWVDLCTEGIHMFIHSLSHNPLTSSSPPLTFDPVANIVSAVILHWDCPPSLLQALALTHPNCKVWLQSYYGEKGGIEEMGTFWKITLGEYRALCKKGASKAIPTMCVLTIKKDEQLMPLWAKSCIVVLGNRENCDWSKSDCFAPVLQFDNLRFLVSLSTQHHRALKQGDCKNAFCQGILLPEETTIVQPPSGDPDTTKDKYWLLFKTLYGLHWSPRHWYEKIDAILCSTGLIPSLHDPCLYTGFIHDPKDPSGSLSSKPLSMGIYVDDFVYFLEDPGVESLFERLLWERVKVYFMGLVKWFLGIHFSWWIKKSAVDVHMNQSGFSANLVKQFCHDEWDHTPDATPYQSGIPIDLIAPSTDADDSPTQI
jgi:hypothetical protein